MDLHLNPEAIAAIYAQLGTSGHFPQNQGKWAKWLFLAIWAHNAHLRNFAHFDAKCPKDTFPPFGPVFGSEPKSGQKPQRTRNTFPSSEAITSIFFPSVFPPQDLWTNSMVEISNGHFNITTYHHVIKEPNHSEDLSRLKSKRFSVKDQSHHQDVIG
ncbi:hypothetical protein O181_087662 [Austropuccinia psidii MF-1]|uniref:Uncharacterized protein n=1 Tax=Austropuccinia psidii MF-1 TaxID=1389203 RepID=A0A9Q3IQ32_9BASI|nr:hypothetical protein [Austropuccinia psidii MF-1]